ncbi:MAG: hypothetical protein LC781_09010 [Actinobacteria bacterium]|nr:hypothetical protein [Actinomycetota bacterium]
MDQRHQKQINEAVERLTEAIRGSYERAAENTTAMHESNSRLVRSLFEGNIELLKAQAEIQAELNRHTLQSLADQIRKHREALLELSRESLEAYDGFVDSLSSYYEEVSKEAEQAVQEEEEVSRGSGEEAIRLLEDWLADESGYDEETWPELKEALDRNRPSDRKLFVD